MRASTACSNCGRFRENFMLKFCPSCGESHAGVGQTLEQVKEVNATREIRVTVERRAGDCALFREVVVSGQAVAISEEMGRSVRAIREALEGGDADE